VAKYVIASPEVTKRVAALLEKHPDRILFGTDEVAPPDQASYLKVYRLYEPLWKLLTPQTSELVRKGNYERIFDDARRRVRAFEKTQAQ
jgi:hypothetical protein